MSEAHKVSKPWGWPFNTRFWWKLLHGVTAEDWRRVCVRCKFTGQAHIHRRPGVCRRFQRVQLRRTV